MAIQIILSQSEACERELIEMGFKKTVVYTKRCPSAGVATDVTKHDIAKGESEIFRMKNKPNQFLVSSWWGASVD